LGLKVFAVITVSPVRLRNAVNAETVSREDVEVSMANERSLPAKAGHHPVTPDGRYFVVRGRLWRMSDPSLEPNERERLVRQLMAARRAVAQARRAGDKAAEDTAHADVDQAKRALGERGPVWWSDRAPDLNRHMARSGPYADWYAHLKADE
jgi:hypothetical protein